LVEAHLADQSFTEALNLLESAPIFDQPVLHRLKIQALKALGQFDLCIEQTLRMMQQVR
jgi:hypothetical protein